MIYFILKRYKCLTICLLLFPGFIFAQEERDEIRERSLDVSETRSKEAVKQLYKAREKYIEGDYSAARNIYLDLIQQDSSDITYVLELGITYYDSPYEKARALPYFERALKLSSEDTIGEIFYYLGRSYHLANRFDEAITMYKKYEKLVEIYGTDLPGMEEEDFKKELLTNIDQCIYAKDLIANPVKVAITPLSNSINSPVYPDYAPVISADEGLLVFTSRRKGSTGGLIDETGQYYEDIYVSRKVNWEWTSPHRMDSVEELAKAAAKEMMDNASAAPRYSKAHELGHPANTKFHDAALAISSDGQELYLYRREYIYVTRQKGTRWTRPVKMNSNINPGNSRQPSLCISPDGKTLYFASDQKGTLGGQDIFKSDKLPNGEWGPPVNLGSTINTPNDEDSPYMHPDGRTLYFSSKGHRTMGGFDIFKSTLKNEQWTTPENLGYPINTTGDDVHFVINAKGDHAYYASVRERDGKLQSMDIYMLLFEGVSVPVTQLKGVVMGGDPLKPMSATIKIYDKETGAEIASVLSNSATGEYLLLFPPGKNYNVTITADGYKPYSEDIYVPDQKAFYQLFQEINIVPVKAGKTVVGQEISMKNAFFDVENAIRSDSSLYNELVQELIEENLSKRMAEEMAEEKISHGKFRVKGMVMAADLMLPVAANIKLKEKKTGREIPLLASAYTGGAYMLEFSPDKAYELYVSAEGYQPHMETIDVPGEKMFYVLKEDIRLAPLQKEANLPKRFIDVKKALLPDSVKEAQRSEEELLALREAEMDRRYRQKLYEAYVEKLNKETEAKRKEASLKGDTAALAVIYEGGDSLSYKRMTKVDFYIPNDSIARVLNVPVAVVEKITTRPAEEVSDIFKLPASAITQVTRLPEKEQREMLSQPTEVLIADLRKEAEKQEAGSLLASAESEKVANPAKLPSEKTKVPESTTPVIAALTEKDTAFSNVLFDFNKSTLTEDAKQELDKLASYLSSRKGVYVELVGHTDSKGSQAYNIELSRKRVYATKSYLLAKGVRSGMVRARHMGKLQPVAPNENPDKTDNPDGRRLNRRVELRVKAKKG